MRPRAKKNMGLRMSKCKNLLINTPEDFAGIWRQEIFKNENPLHLEIGCGKGAFITQCAINNPDVNYIAIELVDTVILLALEKAMELDLPNLYFIHGNADNLKKYFAENELNRIYINFSDPWPKRRKEHLRLSHTNYLNLYKYVLKPKCEVHQKTDNRPFFDFSLSSFEKNGFELKNVSFDLHKSEFEPNYMTEYEAKFSALGTPINRLEAINPK